MISTCHQKAILSMIRNDCSNCTPKIIPDAHIMHAIEILNACFRLNHSHLSDSSFHFVCLCMRCVPPPSSTPHTPTHTHSSIPRNSILTFINEKKKESSVMIIIIMIVLIIFLPFSVNHTENYIMTRWLLLTFHLLNWESCTVLTAHFSSLLLLLFIMWMC